MRDGQQGVGLSVPLYLLQPLSLLQHVMYVGSKALCALLCVTVTIVLGVGVCVCIVVW